MRVGGNYNLQLKQIESSHNLYYPSLERESPSFSSFFNSHAGLIFDLSYRISSKTGSKGKFFFGFKHERGTLNAKSEEFAFVLGNNVYQKKYSPYVGFGNYFDRNNYYVFYYAFVGFSITSNKGEGKIPIKIESQNLIVDATYYYSDATSFLFGLGIDFENIYDSPITLGTSAYFNYLGIAGRQDIELFYNGKKVGQAKALGLQNIYDNSIGFSVTLSYQLNFQSPQSK